jgi:hypothetical protein
VQPGKSNKNMFHKFLTCGGMPVAKGTAITNHSFSKLMFRLAFLLSVLISVVIWVAGITLYKILQALFLIVCFFIAALLGKMLFDQHHAKSNTIRP